MGQDKTALSEGGSRCPCRRRCGRRQEGGKTGSNSGTSSPRQARCSQSVLDFLSTTDIGRRVPAAAEEDARSEASEWEPRERRKRGEERRHEAEELGAEVEERPLFFPTPSFIDYTEDELERVGCFLSSFLFVFFLFSPWLFPWVPYHSWERPGRRAKGSLERAAFLRTADGNRSKCTPPPSI
jgi:hypothetical protein